MEKILAYFYKNNLQREAKKSGYIEITDYFNELKFFANLISESENTIELGSSLWACGFIDNEILLPLQCRWTDSQELNLNLLKILIMKSIAIKKLNIQLDFNDKSRNYPRMFVLTKMNLINQWLDQNFPQFKNFEAQIYDNFKASLQKNYLFSNKVFEYWQNQIISRSSETSVTFNEVLKYLNYTEKSNDTPLLYLHATVPLPIREGLIYNNTSKQQDTSNTSSKKTKSRERKEFVINIDNKKKESVNPVTHSFEKIETLDDYTGGNRISSGDDELDDHSSALDELEVNQFTSQGKASGIFRQDMSFTKNSEGETAEAQLTHDHAAKLYSEWNYKNKSYTKNFCQLYEEYPQKKDNTHLYTHIISESKNKIHHWSQFYSDLWNKPLWKNRQIDGTELDVDNIIRIAPHLKTISGSPKIFQKKEKIELEIDLAILVDISYSTDTWLNDKKIIDTIKESVLVFGEAIKPFTANISVALTYSQTRKNITYLPLIRFGDGWESIYSMIHEFKSRQYTRLGPAIRHCSQLLNSVQSKKPILIVITDGKPTDLDPYEGLYGQNDVKKSIEEATSLGIQTLLVGITDLNPVSLAKIAHNYANVSNSDDFCLEVGKFITKAMRS